MTVLSATTGYHATHIHDITYPAYVKSAAASHIVCMNVYIMCIDNCKYVLKSTLCTEYIKSLLLSHHHSTSALVSEILMSVLQTVQKNNRQFTYGQTVQKKQQTIYIWTDSAKKLHWSIYSAPDSAKKQQQFTYGQTVQKNNSNLHMDSTYLQTVQKTMCKIHIHVLSTLSVL